MKKANRHYPLTQSPLHRLKSKRDLAELLETPVSILKKIEPGSHYHTFQMPKADGTTRKVSAPDEQLKKIQRRLLNLLQRIETPDWLISGTQKKSYIDNAAYHAEAEYVLTIDIRKFYDNCKHKYVNRLFRDQFETSPDVAHILTQITTLSWGLPTGAPTSQLIAFFAYRNAFLQLDELAKTNGCKFTLYVDDITFSSKTPLASSLLLEESAKILHSVGHRLKYSKIKLYGMDKPKLITGVVLDGEKVERVPNKLRLSIMRDLNTLRNCQISTSENEKLQARLLGRIHAARRIERRIFPEVYNFVCSFPQSRLNDQV